MSSVLKLVRHGGHRASPGVVAVTPPIPAVDVKLITDSGFLKMNEPLEGAPSKGSWEDIPSRLGARLQDLGARSSRHGPIHARDTLTFVVHSRLPVQSILFIAGINRSLTARSARDCRLLMHPVRIESIGGGEARGGAMRPVLNDGMR